MKKSTQLFLSFILGFIFIGCATTVGNEIVKVNEVIDESIKLKAPEDRTEVPYFTLKDINGNEVHFDDFKNKVVVISFWATWCEPCKQELSFLNKFYNEFNEQGFSVLAVSVDAPETQTRVRIVSRQKRWKMPVVIDEAGSVASLLNPRGSTPYSVFVDKSGKIAYAHEGYMVGDEIKYKPIIEQLLSE